MIDSILRTRIWAEIENQAAAGASAGAPASAADAADRPAGSSIQERFRRTFDQLLKDLRFELSYHVQTWFQLDRPETEVQQALNEILDRLFGREQRLTAAGLSAEEASLLPSVAQDQPAPVLDATAHALARIRRYWYRSRPTASNHERSLLPGLDHVAQAGFFSLQSQEIATWARWFLLIEAYHRLDPVENEARLDRYRQLREHRSLIRRPSDLLLWLEQSLIQHNDGPLEALSRRLAGNLEARLAPELRFAAALDAQLYVLLRCHQVCAAETWDSSDQDRLAQLLASRRLQNLVDLMLLVLDETLSAHPLPEVGVLLDRLQAQGFNIHHEAFRDPYEASLIPLEDTVRFEHTQLRLFLPLAGLSGDYAADLALSRTRLFEEHDKILAELREQHQAYRGALEQPLPRAHLLAQVAEYLVSWQLSRCPWPVGVGADELAARVRQAYPETVRSLLVRPRKGYEFKSRSALESRIEAACRIQTGSLDRIARRHQVTGLHDYQVLLRYLTLRPFDDPAAEWRPPPDPNAMAVAAERLGLHPLRPTADTPETVAAYLNARIPCQDLLRDMTSGFDMSDQELEQVYRTIQDRFSPALYQLVVAAGRHQAGAPRVVTSTAALEPIVELLVPPFQTLVEQARTDTATAFRKRPAAGYRAIERPCLLDEEERQAYLAWVFHGAGQGSVNGGREPDPEAILKVLRNASAQAETPLQDPLAPSLEALVCSWLSPRPARIFSPAAGAELAALLPQLNCGACGSSNCRAFAENLLAEAAEPKRCPHLSGMRLIRLVETWRQILSAQANPQQAPRLIDLLRDRRAYRRSSERRVFERVLSPQTQKARRLLLADLEQHWRRLEPKPAIFRAPDLETFYRHLVGFLGLDAVEELQPDEREFLAQHGEHHDQSQWRELQRGRDWLEAARRRREGGPQARRHDPAHQARRAYRAVLYLNQLSQHDRRLILMRRLRNGEDGFAGWWNEDLLTLNHPHFAIGTWDEFTKIIKNAYWHQERSLVPMELAEQAWQEVEPTSEADDRFHELIAVWTAEERARLDGDGAAIALEGDSQTAVLDPLRRAIERISLELSHGSFAVPLTAAPGFDSEEQEQRFRRAVWERFQHAAVSLPTPFPCQWKVLSPEEREWFSRMATVDQVKALQRGSAAGPTAPTDVADPLAALKVTVIEALIAAAATRIDREFREKQAVDQALTGQEPPPALAAPLRSWIRHSLVEGRGEPEILAACQELGRRRRDWRAALMREALRRLIVWRHLDQLTRTSPAILPAYQPSGQPDLFLERHPGWRRLLDRVPDRPPQPDRERLLHSLFYLAKMEGDLAVLTALLREIRETSDIIEAAWLNFTQERLKEGPYPAAPPGAGLGLPLLHLRVKDKDRLNHCLRQGLARGEKEDLAAAVNELLLIVRARLLSSADAGDGPAEVAAGLRRIGYDLSGIDPAALEAAVVRELGRKDQLQADRIWIIASATARRLAAQNSEWLELERRFHQLRLDILSEANRPEWDRLLAHRGIALGRIKEAMYRELSDLLETERVASFRKRIRQIVDQLDLKRVEIYRAWLDGAINRRSVFYLLRQFQKQPGAAEWSDCLALLRDHWFRPSEQLARSDRPDREARLTELDERFQALLGMSLRRLQARAEADADAEYQRWQAAELRRLPSLPFARESAHE